MVFPGFPMFGPSPRPGDGSALELCRLNEVDDATWAELTDFVATLT
jgi:hypothetical protein